MTLINQHSPEQEGWMFGKGEVKLVIGVVLSPQTNLYIHKSVVNAFRWQVPQDNKPALPSLHGVGDWRTPRQHFREDVHAR